MAKQRTNWRCDVARYCRKCHRKITWAEDYALVFPKFRKTKASHRETICQFCYVDAHGQQIMGEPGKIRRDGILVPLE